MPARCRAEVERPPVGCGFTTDQTERGGELTHSVRREPSISGNQSHRLITDRYVRRAADRWLVTCPKHRKRSGLHSDEGADEGEAVGLHVSSCKVAQLLYPVAKRVVIGLAEAIGVAFRRECAELGGRDVQHKCRQQLRAVGPN